MSRRRRPDRLGRARPGRPRAATFVAAAVLAGTLSGCASLPAGQPRAAAPMAPPRPAQTAPTDQLSAELADYYARVERERVANRLMRTDNGDEMGRVSASRLAEIYMDVALREEHARGPMGFAGSADSVLRRWEAPVTYAVEFSDSVSRARREQDHRWIEELVARLSEAARHPMRVAPLGSTQGNFHVLVLTESDRRNAGPRLRALIPGIDDSAVRLITDMPRDTFCMAMAFSRDSGAVYTEAVAVIRAEHPDLTRLACYHEELTQGLGLAADSARARPSIFNDDQEFALITEQDLLLLRLHYDPRLRPGMSAARARDLIFSIASELVAGES